ncbi:cohesin domain-containing protein [Methylovulum psychrotolerans]|uniref:PEP-CTERM protein-sorting domain-containing protein n=1 Tax=Methylovulum psychrotolerans TaxID=1704499 RepID=A0A2S5CRK2_9GAMM|nr:cohesin domain-containing protein [Methylovulum psychrotolerans]POZ53449.1 hypothetical protein AADEFJLK_00474 [Methylovulum psychrotolerans]
MNTLFKKGVMVALLSMSLPLQAITISISPIVQTVTVGSSFDEAIILSGLGDHVAPSVGTFDLTVSFNATQLSFSGVTFGDPVLGDQLDLAGLGSLQLMTPDLGSVNLFELSFDEALALESLQADSFILATLSFQALAVGTDSLNFTLNSLGDAFGNPLTADLINGNITVSSSDSPTDIPEPEAWTLLGTAIALFTIRSALRKRQTLCATVCRWLSEATAR